MSEIKCWICGQVANTGENMIKSSDLRFLFGKPSTDKPLFFNATKIKNRRIFGLKADILKSPAKLCAHCNNTRTQESDLAWEEFSETFLTRHYALQPGETLVATKIFPEGTYQKML